MQGYGLQKAYLVVFLSFLAIALSAICIVGTAAAFFDIRPTIVGLALFIVIIVVAGLIVRTIAGILLFEHAGAADFQVYCGTQNPNIAFSGPTTASWPFAKLTATKTILRLQSPWGDFHWTNDGASPNIRRPQFPMGNFTILNTGVGPTAPVSFSVLPWRIKSVENALRSLEYKVSLQPTRVPKTSNRTYFLILWLAGSGFMVFGPPSVGAQFLSARGISLHPARIKADVSSKNCAQKNQVTYRFEIEGVVRQVERFGSVGCPALNVDDAIDITYDRQNPDWNAWTNDPNADYSRALGNLLVAGFGFPALIAYALIKKFRPKD
ncbi:hypothetical protein K9U39_20745 [Rhodoblastus acidophilus]|uniref:DUF3592 domain-containing protein n=1 Tax=Candidatus Rhodoblastus alkanivorans TaxID=2954117 RepID=A0ABS9ZCG6_9HYPH|nr:hypothetical protein [Candidatus Rhodoblastus alkanivorans]MCI4680832.1 hypothetical protein [Candidatus Rhodoblastus alkanivorans]MCI4685041.1 hypothetical protein [Candidatus Rhodoblastus alkanivorans]MDI4643313.1 hypothetical protein [Rhodoblastus acidophilus]